MSQAAEAALSTGGLADAQTQTQRRESLSPVTLDHSSVLGSSPKYHTPTSPCSGTNRSSSTFSESTCTSPDSSQHHSPFAVSAQSPAISIPRLPTALPSATSLPSVSTEARTLGAGGSPPQQTPGLFNPLSTLASACAFSNGSTQTPFGTIHFPAPSATTSSLAVSSFSTASLSLAAATTSSNDVAMSASPDSLSAAAVLNSFSHISPPQGSSATPKASAGLTVSVPANPYSHHPQGYLPATSAPSQMEGVLQQQQSNGSSPIGGVVIPSPTRVDIASEPALPYVAHSLKRYKAPATSADDCKGALLLSFIRFQAKSSPNGELDPPDPEIMRRIDMLAESMTKEEAAIPTPKRACVSPSANSLASPAFASSSSSPFQPAKPIAHSQSAQNFGQRFDWDVPAHNGTHSRTNSPVPVPLTPLTPSHLNFHNLSMHDPSRYSPLIANAGQEPIPITALPSLASPSTPPHLLPHSLSTQSLLSQHSRVGLPFSYSSSFVGHGHATRPNWVGGFPSPTTVNAARVAQFLSNVDEKAGEGSSDIDEETMSSSHNATDEDELGSGESAGRSPEHDNGDIDMHSVAPSSLPLPIGRTRLPRAQSFDPSLLQNPGSPVRVAVPRSRSPVLGRTQSPIPLPPPEELPPDFQDTFSTLQALAALSSRPVSKHNLHSQHSEPHSPGSPWSAFDHHSPPVSGFADHSRKSRSPNSTSLSAQKARRKAKAASMTLFSRARSSSDESAAYKPLQHASVTSKAPMPVFPSLNLHILRKDPSLSSVNSFGTASSTPPVLSPPIPITTSQKPSPSQTFTLVTQTSATPIPSSLTIPTANVPPKIVTPSPTSSSGDAALTPSGRPQRLRKRPSKLSDTAEKGDTA